MWVNPIVMKGFWFPYRQRQCGHLADCATCNFHYWLFREEIHEINSFFSLLFHFYGMVSGFPQTQAGVSVWVMLSYASFEGFFHPRLKLVTILLLNPKQKLWKDIEKFVLIPTPLEKTLKVQRSRKWWCFHSANWHRLLTLTFFVTANPQIWYFWKWKF